MMQQFNHVFGLSEVFVVLANPEVAAGLTGEVGVGVDGGAWDVVLLGEGLAVVDQAGEGGGGREGGGDS